MMVMLKSRSMTQSEREFFMKKILGFFGIR